MNQDFIITTYAENKIGILYRILNVFAKRMINVESLTVVESDTKGVSKITFVIASGEKAVKQIIKHIEKQIGVLHTVYYTNSEITLNKVSLYRMFTKSLSSQDEQLPVFEHYHSN